MLAGRGGLLLLPLLLVSAAALADERTFEPRAIAAWESHSFTGNTDYAYAEAVGQPAVHARCTQDTSSGLFLRETIELTKTPVIEWSWRVDDIYEDVDETVKAGDDYPARIYVVDEHPIFPWRTRALSYVWSSTMEEGEDWTNAYADQVHMIAVDAGEDGLGTWHSYRRNLREDFQRYHDRDLEQVDAIAIMSDCDDAGQTSEAWFGTIQLRGE
ncbi:MAG: DUF3047 domain-containing protein [Halofilum sp. (in: g-proteobacteria)]